LFDFSSVSDFIFEGVILIDRKFNAKILPGVDFDEERL
jgi:hypothetical protein